MFRAFSGCFGGASGAVLISLRKHETPKARLVVSRTVEPRFCARFKKSSVALNNLRRYGEVCLVPNCPLLFLFLYFFYHTLWVVHFSAMKHCENIFVGVARRAFSVSGWSSRHCDGR